MTSSANVITRRDVWQTLWRFASSDRLLAAGLFGIVLLLAAAALLPQAPQGDAAAFARWFSNAQLRFGGATSLLSGLGLFDIAHSVFFRALAGVLGLALFTRLIDSLSTYRETARHAPPPAAPAQSLELDRSRGAIAGQLRRYRITHTDSFTLADRFPWANLGAIAAHLGPLVILAGLALSPLVDWRVEDANVLPNSATPIAETPYTLLAAGIAPDGRVTVTLKEGDLNVMDGIAAPGQPVHGNAASIYVRDVLPALRVSAQDAGGQTLELQTSAQGEASGELLLTFDADQMDEFFAAPDVQIAIRVSLIGDTSSPQYRVTVFNSSDARQIAEETFSPPASIAAGDIRFDFTRESHVVVAAVHAPAQTIIAVGAIVALAGIAVAAYRPALRVWLAPQGSGTRLMCDRPDFDLRRFTD